jgi:DNA-binding SARP family transcriptional activator
VYIQMLGGFQLQVDNCTGSLSPMSQRVISRLALSECISRSRLAGELWPDTHEARARHSLRSVLSRLAHECPGLIVRAGDDLRLADEVNVDVRELRQWMRLVLGGGELNVLPNVACGGELLPGWSDEWVQLERSHLRQMQICALEAAADLFASAGRLRPALEAALVAVRADPLRETAWRTVIQVYLRQGNVSQALRAYADFRALLIAEIGLEPTAETTRLVGPLLAASAVRRATVAAQSSAGSSHVPA